MIIRDEMLKPYFIEIDHNNHTVCREKNVQSGKNHGRVRKKEHGYFTTMDAALREILELKIKDKKETLDLKEYLNLIKEQNRMLEELTSRYDMNRV